MSSVIRMSRPATLLVAAVAASLFAAQTSPAAAGGRRNAAAVAAIAGIAALGIGAAIAAQNSRRFDRGYVEPGYGSIPQTYAQPDSYADDAFQDDEPLVTGPAYGAPVYAAPVSPYGYRPIHRPVPAYRYGYGYGHGPRPVYGRPGGWHGAPHVSRRDWQRLRMEEARDNNR